MARVRAVLFDRDGTLVVNVPYNGDPNAVILMPDALDALTLLREAGLQVGIVSNQSGVGRGLITLEAMRSVNAHLETLLGRMDGWFICPHAPDEGCPCRKPSPRLVFEAAHAFHCRAAECVVVGDLRSDMDAAIAAGARSILVPTKHTPAHDVEQVPQTAKNLLEAADIILSRWL